MKKNGKNRYPAVKESAAELKEAALVEPLEATHINVRAAKDQLSSLLESAAQGNEIVITSDGLPKAKLVAVPSTRKPFRVDWELLQSMPLRRGPTVEELVREDRDSRP